MKPPTKEMIDKYLKSDNFCPWCGSKDIHTASRIQDLSQDIECHNPECLAEWRDEYGVVAVSWEDYDEDKRVFTDELEDAERAKAAKRIIDMIRMCNFGDDVLDEHIHELFSNTASKINNEGIEIQVYAILKEMGLQAGVEWISDILAGIINDAHIQKEKA